MEHPCLALSYSLSLLGECSKLCATTRIVGVNSSGCFESRRLTSFDEGRVECGLDNVGTLKYTDRFHLT